jgi:PhnB protein
MSTVTPYVMVESARPFVSFLENAFDAEVSNVVPLPTDPERVIHAEARIGTGALFFADSGPDGGQCQRFPAEPAHIQMWLTVPDADAAYSRAVAGGATPVMDVTGQDDGARMGGFMAFGALWWVNTPA